MMKPPEFEGITFDDVLLIPQYNNVSRRLVQTNVADKTEKLSLGIPLLTANMDTITGHKMANWIGDKGGAGVLHRFMTIEENIEEYNKTCRASSPFGSKTFVSLGTSEEEYERFTRLYKVGARNFCVDVAHGHAGYVGAMTMKMKQDKQDICIMAGNVATYEGAEYLHLAGADIIKVGIGPGSVCTTRIKTGCGVPQLSAIANCVDSRWSVVADGGLRNPGDIVKALAFGADFVMIGGMLSGTHFTPGSAYGKDGELLDLDSYGIPLNNGHGIVKKYRGMASKEVAEDYVGGLTSWKTAEGVATTVPYKGPDESEFIIHDIIGGLRSGLTYNGSLNIPELQRKYKWIKVSEATKSENRAHKVS